MTLRSLFYDFHKTEAGIVCGLTIAALTAPFALVYMHIHATSLQEAAAAGHATISPALTINQATASSPAAYVTSQAAAGTQTVWPIHGRITTEFGVYHEPYQKTHTGIDISDGKPSGTSAVTVFRSGTVLQVSHSGGYGNHVIVDHGNGLTSLYGHLYSISVVVGQHVNPGDTLGYEGSTGDSTGPHVHFEIRLNNQPVNPHLYETGNP